MFRFTSDAPAWPDLPPCPRNYFQGGSQIPETGSVDEDMNLTTRSALALITLVAAACSDAAPLQPLAARITVQPTHLDFGEVPLGEEKRARAILEVTGEVPTRIGAPGVRDDVRTAFGLSTNFAPGLIPSGTQVEIEVLYRPRALERDLAAAIIPFEAGGIAAVITVEGRGRCPWGEDDIDGECTTSSSPIDAGFSDSAVPPEPFDSGSREEVCDGTDNDENGLCDEPFACCAGSSVECTTSCGSRGTGTCTGVCGLPDICTPPSVELCNGIDDDCDCRIDEGCPNLLDNPGFEEGLAGWGHWIDAASGAQASISVEDGAGCDGSRAARIDVSRVSTQRCGALPCAHAIELRQVALPAVEGRRARISFGVRATNPGRMSVGFRQLCGANCGGPACGATCPAADRNETQPFTCCFEPYVGAEHTFEVTGAGWQNVTYTFPAVVIDGPDTSRVDGRLLFNVGTATGTVWFDDVHLELL